AAYSSHSDGFEFVVADAGIGVLESLRQNPQFGDLSDSGAALCTAMQDGVSSIVNQGNRGYGIGLLFRKLAGHGGDVRFRSGDHALTVRGNSLSLNGNAEIAQRAATPGLAVSILCRRPH
ncbi:MAG: hypothetical protein JWP08_4023, partial [Bryobacterales bacterium]|nr:hypothetical protein [Bryobacterales bacterium]